MSKESTNPQENSDNQIVWAIHESHPEIADSVRTKLSEVIDPEIGLDVIQLGLIRDVVLEQETAHIKMMLTTPFCPYGPEMLEFTRIKAEVAIKKPVTIELIPDIWETSLMEDPTLLDWGLY